MMQPPCGHQEYANGCPNCKLYSVRIEIGALKRANRGESVTFGETDRQYAKRMYDHARANGQDDPIPMNKKAAAVAPAKGVFRKATGV